MCAEYTIRTDERDLSGLLGRELTAESDTGAWDFHARLYNQAPIIRTAPDGTTLLHEAAFSLLPRGGRVPFTANARLDDWDERRGQITYIYQRPTWRDAFLNRRCVIPVTEFLEPIYRGEHAGHMMAFRDVRERTLFVAGIYQETVDQSTGLVFQGFAMLTDFAHPYVRQVGHHRTIVLLEPAEANRWIKPEPISGAAGVEFLVKHAARPELTVRAVREMKNWRARVKNAVANADAEFEVQKIIEGKRAGGSGQTGGQT